MKTCRFQLTDTIRKMSCSTSRAVLMRKRNILCSSPCTEMAAQLKDFPPPSTAFGIKRSWSPCPGGYPRAIGGYSWFMRTPDRGIWEAEDRISVSRKVVEVISDVALLYPVEKAYRFGFSQGSSPCLHDRFALHPSLISGGARRFRNHAGNR